MRKVFSYALSEDVQKFLCVFQSPTSLGRHTFIGGCPDKSGQPALLRGQAPYIQQTVPAEQSYRRLDTERYESFRRCHYSKRSGNTFRVHKANIMLRNQITNQWCRLPRQALCIAFLLGSLFTSQQSTAQWMDVDPVQADNCGSSRCCYYFTYGHWDDSYDVTKLEITGINKECWDVTCAVNQTVSVNGTPTTATLTWNGPNPIITFNPAIEAFTQVEFLLCPEDPLDCFGGITTYGWRNYDNSVPPQIVESPGNIPFNRCPGNSPDCLGCDQTVIYRINDCYHDVCYKRRSTSGLSGPILITFSPALEIDCVPVCTDDYGGAREFSEIDIPTGWGTQNVTYDGSGDLESFEIYKITGGIDACEEICITIPACDDHDPITVTMSDKNNPNDCSPSPQADFKRGDLDGESPSQFILMPKSGESNYPNPVTSASDFRTMIPFTISASAEARITFMDESGRTVHTETQTFEGAGKHFFFFTGSVLPSGMYYYTIESPLGAPIVKRSLLIVK